MNKHHEMEELKKRLKNRIEGLITNGNFEQASLVIDEYEKTVKDDIEIISMKAIILMIKKDWDKAEEILWQGVEIDTTNVDILYNLAYLNQCRGDYFKSINFYKKALSYASDKNLKQEIIDNLGQLEKVNEVAGKSSSKRFIILSSCGWGPMLQRPHQIAKALSKFGYTVDYFEPSRNVTLNTDCSLDLAIQYSKKMSRGLEFVNILTPISVFNNERFIINNYKELVQDTINNSSEEIVIICYLPSQFGIINELYGNFKVVYECVDDHSDLEHSFLSNKHVRELKQLLPENFFELMTLVEKRKEDKECEYNHKYKTIREHVFNPVEKCQTDEDEGLKQADTNFSRDNKRTRFSIVIPTRNSSSTLEYTLRTCLNQEFDNYEIIVSDNSSDELTKTMIDRINDGRIKYYKPEKELAMTENFNFAVSKASGEYILLLGSDDGLLFHALQSMDEILNSLQTKILQWNTVFYGWPDVKLEGYENFISIPYTIKNNVNYSEIESEGIMKSVANFTRAYNALPMLYCNAVIHKDVITQLIEKTGSVFKGISPDVYSGFALGYLQKRFITVNIPMTIGGASGKSNGISFSHGKDNESDKIRADFLKLNNQAGLGFQSILPNVRNLVVAITEAFISAKEALFPNDLNLNFDRKKMIQNCADDLCINDVNFITDLNSIYRSLEDDPELISWFYENYINNPNYTGNINKRVYTYNKGFTANYCLNLNTEEFNVHDVYGAAELFRKITGW